MTSYGVLDGYYSLRLFLKFIVYGRIKHFFKNSNIFSSNRTLLLCELRTDSFCFAYSLLRNCLLWPDQLAGPLQAMGLGGFSFTPPHVFGRTVNPISTRLTDYAHHSITSPPGFSDLATALNSIPKLCRCAQNSNSI